MGRESKKSSQYDSRYLWRSAWLELKDSLGWAEIYNAGAEDEGAGDLIQVKQYRLLSNPSCNKTTSKSI
jgi:hypothetical protein